MLKGWFQQESDTCMYVPDKHHHHCNTHDEQLFRIPLRRIAHTDTQTQGQQVTRCVQRGTVGAVWCSQRWTGSLQRPRLRNNLGPSELGETVHGSTY